MIYDYKCLQCGKVTEATNKIAERHTNAPECHGQMQLFISQPPRFYIPMEIRYRCPVTRAGVTSKKQRVEIMARHDLLDANDLVTDKSIAAHVKRKEDQDAFVKANQGPQEVQKQVNQWAMEA